MSTKRFLEVWIALRAFCCSLGVVYVSGGGCESDQASLCYSDLVHYESLAFPLYGHDYMKLDEICQHINISFECIESYAETCYDTPDCDEECHDLIRDTRAFAKSTGLKQLADEMCSPYSAVRAIYLENYECLESNADLYAACHNDSQLSQEFLTSIEGADMIPARCCFFTWYHDCFTNITRDNCGGNATFFVSFAMHKLIGHIADQLCLGSNVSCERPPMPPSDSDSENELDRDKPDQTNDDIDNTIGESKLSSAMAYTVSMSAMVLTPCLVLWTSNIL